MSYASEHAQLRVKQRHLVPRWLSAGTTDLFIRGLKDHATQRKTSSRDPGLVQYVTSKAIVYERHGVAVTVVKTRCVIE